MPEFLERRKKDRCLIARFRYGNECRRNLYLREEKDKACRICEEEIESLKHVTETCQVTKSDTQTKELLNQDDRGLEDMRKIEKERRNKEEKDKNVKRKTEETGKVDIL